MLKMRSHLLVITVVSVVASFVVQPASAQKKYDVGATDAEIKLGNIVPYSGPASAFGSVGKVQAGFFKMINEQGGINGRKINYISYDDAYSPAKAVEQARKLVENDEVLAMFAILGTASNSAIQKYLNAKKSAAFVCRQRRHEMERSEELPLDHRIFAELPGRSAHLCEVYLERAAQWQDRGALSERRSRQGLSERPA